MKTKKSISDDVRRAIALRAYHIWESEGRPQDRHQAHWQMAEAEILGEQIAEAPAPRAETPLTMAKPVKKKAAVAPPTSTKPSKTAEVTAPAAKAPKLKAAAAKAAEGAKKTAKVGPTKKAVKAKGAARPS